MASSLDSRNATPSLSANPRCARSIKPLYASEWRAQPRSCASERPSLPRAASYSSTIEGPNIRESSTLIVHGTPALMSVGSGCRSMLGTTFKRTFDVGHTSQQTLRPRSSSSVAGSSQARTPCWSRSARSSSTAARQLSGPRNSPACGVEMSPASAAIRKASAKGPGGKGPFPSSVAPSEACSPKETTGSPAAAISAASLAVPSASRGSQVRTAGTIQRTSTPYLSWAALPAENKTSHTDRSGTPHRSARRVPIPNAGSR
mmetsp:Transcript_59567/g.167810  ORF Transcript_59567/g.167810 Transcript_59567/m.167810 type:complete len:260 (-) Transcript_59567:346-1125(-)